jgi:hypothetical protein
MNLLTKDHPITEKGMMEFQPFGKGPDGRTIHDLSGIVIKAAVEHLEDVVARKKGADAGRCAVEEHVRRLNSRIPNPAYHVTVDFLKNPWNGYSNEFSAFNGQFSLDISEDSRFNFSMGRDKAITPIIQVLGRPFSVAQIYKMSAYFSQRYGKDSFLVEAAHILDRSATLRMTFTERMCQHFGRYRRACAFLWCDAVKGYFTGVPEHFHGLAPGIVEDRRCIAEGDEYCEWLVTWSGRPRRLWPVAQWLARSRRRETEATSDQPTRPLRQGDLQRTASTKFSVECRRPDMRPASKSAAYLPGLLSEEHPITERGTLSFQPFGVDPDGTPIRDVSGATIRACIEHLEEYITRTHGLAAGKRATDELARRLNAAILDHNYHVTVSFLKKPWNTYSYEFVAFLCQMCRNFPAIHGSNSIWPVKKRSPHSYKC